jgi:hypothetical protein
MNNQYFACRKWLCIALSGLCLIAAVTNADEVLEKRQARIAAELESLPAARGRCVLFSLEPADRVRYVINNEKYFHGFSILGKADVDEAKDRNTLIATLANGVRESDGVGSACFNPRHGIRLIFGEATYDFVICFECKAVRSYGFNEGIGFGTSDGPNNVFNSFLDTFRLKKAKKDPNGK